MISKLFVHLSLQINGEKHADGSCTHLLEKLRPGVGSGFVVEKWRVPVYLCETLTSSGGFLNYKLLFHTFYNYISHFNAAGIPDFLPVLVLVLKS